VLLKHVNDDATVMTALVQKLLMCRVKPYYFYQCDLISGSAHLRASVSKGLEIMEQLRGHTTGYAVPQYVIDAPGGGGKVPINPNTSFAATRDACSSAIMKGRFLNIPKRKMARRCPRRRKKLSKRNWPDFHVPRCRVAKFSSFLCFCVV
jgi:lysine 2,3-aminomutase